MFDQKDVQDVIFVGYLGRKVVYVNKYLPVRSWYELRRDALLVEKFSTIFGIRFTKPRMSLLMMLYSCWSDFLERYLLKNSRKSSIFPVDFSSFSAKMTSLIKEGLRR